MCEKICYTSFAEALKVINRAKRFRAYRDGRRVKRRSPPQIPRRPYKCPECGFYHLSHLKTFKEKCKKNEQKNNLYD